ncbi:Retrovirus-related Pol polyprotein from transposon [Ceratobasidium sp. AG-Ba]|nr:Retrovirus-related Pol polyprotein from transposon [Ceratobasidium sp. AG-Ba]
MLLWYLCKVAVVHCKIDCFDDASTESVAAFEPNPTTSPTVVRRQGPSPLPAVAALGLRTGSLFTHPPILSTGPQTPPTLGSAAASVPVGPISTVCGGPFYDDGQPKPEVEYRRNFIFATLGLSDEQIASLWANHLVYNSLAHDWYKTLIASSAGEAAAKKWSTLQPEIEKRWPTPARDLGATRRRHRARWREHKFDIWPMLEALANESASTKPHQAWAQHHKALGAALTMTDKDRVLQTIEGLPVYLLELLPKRNAYTDKWEDLIKDIGNISSRLLLNRYNQQSMMDSMYSMSLNQSSQQSTTPRWRNARLDRSPPPPNPSTPCSPRLYVAPAASAPTPNPFTRPRTPTSQARDPPPHFPIVPPTPHTPGPVPSFLSQVQNLVEPPAGRSPHRSGGLSRFAPAPMSRQPPPARGVEWAITSRTPAKPRVPTYWTARSKTTAESWLASYEMTGRRGVQPSTPTPQQRVRDTAQLDFSEPDFDPDSDLGSGNE